MNTSRMSIVLSAVVLVLAGCQKASDPPTPVTSSATGSAPSTAASAPSTAASTPSTTASTPSTSSTSSSTSVAAPPSAVPPSDAAIKPDVSGSTGNSGNAQSPTQANPGALTKQEEKTAMPQSGQVNNHSVPDTTGEKK